MTLSLIDSLGLVFYKYVKKQLDTAIGNSTEPPKLLYLTICKETQTF